MSQFHHAPRVGSVALIVVLSTSGVGAEPSRYGGERVLFQDVTNAAGLSSFNHYSYTFGGDGLAGVAWFDYNNDGLLDVYFSNGQDKTTPGHDGFDNALFENQGGGEFVDVAALRGVTHGEGSAGVVTADIDNDGDQDIFLTGDGGMLGHDGIDGSQTVDSGVALYVNGGPPDFNYTRIDNAAAGLVGIESTMSAAMADIDADGLLDLFIASSGTRPIGCLPPECADDGTQLPHGSKLFVNRSSGGAILYEDVSTPSTVGDVRYGALAAAFSDYNNDGLPDLLVANGVAFIYEDTPLQLYENQGYDSDLGSPVFADVSVAAGLGNEAGWMGFAIADFDGNRNLDLFVTNTGSGGTKPHALNRWAPGLGQYHDVASFVGINGPAPNPSEVFGWGCVAEDFDLDGRPDIFFAGNGVASPSGSGPVPNPGTLLMNDAPLFFSNYNASLSVDLSNRFTSGVAAGDYDNDGLVDLAIATDNLNGDLGVPVLLQNVTANDHRWITVRLHGNGTTTNRDAIGARIAVAYGTPPNRVIQVRELHAGSSFLSTNSKWQTFGLGPLPDTQPVIVAVDWPDGPQTPGDFSNWTIYGAFATNEIVDIAE